MNTTTTTQTVARILAALLSPRQRVTSSMGQDYLTTRAQRTAQGWGVELEAYEDGSGFELAFRGRVWMVGVEVGAAVVA